MPVNNSDGSPPPEPFPIRPANEAQALELANSYIEAKVWSWADTPQGKQLVSRDPTPEEIAVRREQARKAAGFDGFEAHDEPLPAPTHEQQVVGIDPTATPEIYSFNIPKLDPETAERMRTAFAENKMARPLAEYLGERIMKVAKDVHRMTEDERIAWRAQQWRNIEAFAQRRGWPAEVMSKLGAEFTRKDLGDPFRDSDWFLRVALHHENLAKYGSAP